MVITREQITNIIRMHNGGYSLSEIYSEVNKNQSLPKEDYGFCSKKDALYLLRDGNDKEYYFNNKEKSDKFWNENYYQGNKKQKIKIFDYLKREDINKEWQIIKSL